MRGCQAAGFEDEKRDHEPLKNKHRGTFLVVQWLRLQAPNAGGLALISGQRTRSCMPQLRLGTAKSSTQSYKNTCQDFPGGPVAKTPSSQCRGPGFDPWSELDPTCCN